MKVYDDRITIWNDGMLPDGITVESLMKEHASRPRNKNIAAVFYRAGFIESWGRGIKKICKAFTSISTEMTMTWVLSSDIAGIP